MPENFNPDRLDKILDKQFVMTDAGRVDRIRDLYTCTTEDGNEIVAGIWLHEGSPLHEAGYYTGDVVIGVAANAQNLDPAVEFMKSLAANY